MDRAFSTNTDVTPEELYAVLADLGTYPEWMELVDRVEPTDPEADGGQPAWLVTLRGRVGPFARAKRLRMAQTVADGQRVTFERQELDGREHAPWVLTAEVSGTASGSSADVSLHYGGSLWSKPMEAILGRAADDASAALRSYLATQRA